MNGTPHWYWLPIHKQSLQWLTGLFWKTETDCRRTKDFIQAINDGQISPDRKINNENA